MSPFINFLTAEECAKEVRVSKMTIYRCIHEGWLPAVRVGRMLRIREDVWRQFVAEGGNLWGES